MLVVDDNTNVGWTVFLQDKSGPTLCHAFRVCHNAVKLVAATNGSLDIARFGIGHEFTNAEFQKLLTELGIAVEYTPVDGAKRNGRVERKLALIAKGAKVVWLEFPRHFPYLEFPNKALGWTYAISTRSRLLFSKSCRRLCPSVCCRSAARFPVWLSDSVEASTA